MKRILIVEDTKKHMEDAVRVAKELGFEVVTATTAREGQDIIREGGIDAVVTDIYIPLSSSSHLNHSESPCGINVAIAAKKAGVPCIFCTDMGHHGSKLEWLFQITKDLGLPPMVDGGKGGTLRSDYYHGAAGEKLWEKAIIQVIRGIDPRSSTGGIIDANSAGP